MKLTRKRLFIWMLLLIIALEGVVPSKTIFASTVNTESDVILLVNNNKDKVKIEEEFSISNLTYYVIPKSKKIKTNQVIVAGYSGNEKKIIIPKTVTYENKRYTVTKVANKYWETINDATDSQWGTTVDTLVLPDTIDELCEDAFINTQTLKNINIPDNVKYIGADAFAKTKIEKLLIPKGLEMIETPLYETKIKTFNVDKNNKFYKALDNCLYTKDGKTLLSAPAVNKVTIPKNVITIGETAFFGNKNLESIIIPNNVKTIGTAAFDECSNLIDVKMVNGINSIGESAFSNCSSLKNINIPDSITFLGSSAFSNCTSLEKLVIPDGITIINNLVEDCTSLKSIEIPDSVVKIYGLLDGLTSLEKITANKVENRYVQYNEDLIVAGVQRKIEGIDVLLSDEVKAEVKILDDFYKTVNASDSDVVKVKKAHDWLINYVDYDKYALNMGEKDKSWWQSDDPHTYAGSYQGLFKTKLLVCSGYTSAMNLLCRLINIDSVVCVGTEEMKHEWNLIKVDGSWYQLDATWDDAVSNHYKYFLISDEQMAIDHQWDKWEEYPVCNSTITNY